MARNDHASLIDPDNSSSRRPKGNPVNTARGEAVRRALLAVARKCLAGGMPMPTYLALAEALGCDDGQVCRHMQRLRADGALVVSRERRRFRIKEIRP